LENSEFAKFKILKYDYFGPREIKNPRHMTLVLSKLNYTLVFINLLLVTIITIKIKIYYFILHIPFT